MAVADLFGVDAGDPEQWIRGASVPSLDVAISLLDVAAVLRRALLVWEPPVAAVWLRSPNAFLGDASPMDLALAHRSGPVLDALDNVLTGAYA